MPVEHGIRARQVAEQPSSPTTFWLLTLVVLSLCAWVLSLPLFPNQDGPMHLYYVDAIRKVYHHVPLFSDFYQQRQWMPPYVLHYVLLYSLTNVFSPIVAEKLVVCLIVAISAFGFRSLAVSLRSGSSMAALWAAPLFLSWPLFMGFHNYCLALGFSFWAWSFWYRALRTNNWRSGVAFCVITVLVLLSHPVPLLFLLTVTGCDLLRWFWNRQLWNESTSRLRIALVLIAWQVLWIAYVRTFVESAVGVHSPYTVPAFANNAVSFFALRWLCVESGGLGMLLHRLLLALLFAVALVLASRGIRTRLRQRRLHESDVCLILAVLLFVALPLIPQEFNHLAFFSNRMLVFDWLLALAALAGVQLQPRAGRMAMFAALGFSALVLWLTNAAVRPMARQLAADYAAIPLHGKKALAFDGERPNRSATTTFNPYLSLSAARYLTRSGLLLVNDPFLDPPNILPLVHRPNPVLGLMNPSERLFQKTLHGDLLQNSELRNKLLAQVDTLIFAGQAENSAVPDPLVAADAARHWNCRVYRLLSVCEAPVRHDEPVSR